MVGWMTKPCAASSTSQMIYRRYACARVCFRIARFIDRNRIETETIGESPIFHWRLLFFLHDSFCLSFPVTSTFIQLRLLFCALEAQNRNGIGILPNGGRGATSSRMKKRKLKVIIVGCRQAAHGWWWSCQASTGIISCDGTDAMCGHFIWFLEFISYEQTTDIKRQAIKTILMENYLASDEYAWNLLLPNRRHADVDFQFILFLCRWHAFSSGQARE